MGTEIIVAGMFSGLASTGLHQAFKQLIGGDTMAKCGGGKKKKKGGR